MTIDYKQMLFDGDLVGRHRLTKDIYTFLKKEGVTDTDIIKKMKIGSVTLLQFKEKHNLIGTSNLPRGRAAHKAKRDEENKLVKVKDEAAELVSLDEVSNVIKTFIESDQRNSTEERLRERIMELTTKLHETNAQNYVLEAEINTSESHLHKALEELNFYKEQNVSSSDIILYNENQRMKDEIFDLKSRLEEYESSILNESLIHIDNNEAHRQITNSYKQVILGLIKIAGIES